MGRIVRTWELARQSWRVLQADRELLILPVLSMIATVIVAASFLGPVFAGGSFTSATEDPGVGTYLLMFGMYVVLAFVTIFFNAALVSAANERLEGGDPTIGSALRGAAAHTGSILGWALVTATVSVILRSLEERSGVIGRIAISLVGIAWSLVTFMVIPVLVIEGAGVGSALKRSKDLFKRTWGEQVAGQVGFGLLGFLAALPAVVLVVLAIGSGSGAAAGVAIAAGVLWMLVVSVVLSALSGIFQTAMYRFAVDRQAPIGFDQSVLQSSFQPRR